MFLALRELKRNKLRYGLVGSIMLLLSFLVLMISGLANGLSYDNASLLKNTDIEHFAIAKDAENKLLRSQISKEDITALQKEIGEENVIPFYISMVTLEKNNNKKVDVSVLASDTNDTFKPEIIEGRLFEKGKDEVVLDEKAKKKEVKLGDVVKDPVSQKEMTVVGFTKGSMFSHTPVMYTSESFREEIAMKNQKEYNAVALKKETSASFENVKVVEKKTVLEGIPGYKEEQGTLTMIIGFLLVISALLIGVFYYVITLQKTQQIGILKAIGTKSSHLAKSLLIQSVLLSAVSMGIAILLMLGVAAILPEGMPFLLTSTMIIQYTIIFLVISILGTLLSLYQVLKVDPLDAIGGGM